MQRATRSQGELWFLTTPKGSTRHKIAACQKRITREQKACGLPQYSAWVFETRSQLHAHFVLVANRKVAAALRRSRLCIDVKRVTDLEGLKKYLAKERTPQAGYKRRDLGGRIGGSHRLEGGGDRVRLSRQLERDAIEAGLVDPWKRTNAKRSAQRKDSAFRTSARSREIDRTDHRTITNGLYELSGDDRGSGVTTKISDRLQRSRRSASQRSSVVNAS